MCICLRLLMSLTFASHSAIGASNRTYFICKALVSFCHLSIIALLRAFIHYSLYQFPLFFDYLKRNSFLSNDKKLFSHQRYLFQFRSNAFCFEQDSSISWKETFFPRNKIISIGAKTILLYNKCVLLSSKLVLLYIKNFLLHVKSSLLCTNYILLAQKALLLSIKCLLLKPYICCLIQTVFCLGYKHIGQMIFYFGSCEKYLLRHQIHFRENQNDFEGSRQYFA